MIRRVLAVIYLYLQMTDISMKHSAFFNQHVIVKTSDGTKNLPKLAFRYSELRRTEHENVHGVKFVKPQKASNTNQTQKDNPTGVRD